MGKKDPRVDSYIAKAADFAKPVLEHFRSLVHKVCPDATETIKWGAPSFDYKGPYCLMVSFKKHCAIIFYKNKIMKNQAPKDKTIIETDMAQLRKITSIKDLPKDKVLTAYLKNASKINDAGIKIPSRKKSNEKKELEIPDYFVKALKKNKNAQKTFNNFTYSKKKDYVEWIAQAKREETRLQRIETAIEWLAEGKTRNWKYEKC